VLAIPGRWITSMPYSALVIEERRPRTLSAPLNYSGPWDSKRYSLPPHIRRVAPLLDAFSVVMHHALFSAASADRCCPESADGFDCLASGATGGVGNAALVRYVASDAVAYREVLRGAPVPLLAWSERLEQERTADEFIALVGETAR
jgi:hypothetical protein